MKIGDHLQALAARAPQLQIMLVVETLLTESSDSEHFHFIEGNVLQALEKNALLRGQRDIYAAGPPNMFRALARALDERKIDRNRVHMDSFGVWVAVTVSLATAIILLVATALLAL